MRIKSSIIISICLALAPLAAWAETMSSTNYYIQLDSFASGDTSTSTNYSLIDTIGEIGDETSTSTNYQVIDGLIGSFQDGVLTATLSSGSVAFGELSTDSVTTGSIIITVTTDSMSGYTIRLSESGEFADGGNDIDDVSDFEVTAGAEEYGFRTSGTSGTQNTRDVGITSALLTIANSSSAVTSEATTVTFKAAIDSSTAEGSYAHTVTFATVANF